MRAVGFVILLVASSALACDTDCWVRIFQKERFNEAGASVTLCGATELPTLKLLEGRDWRDDIDSIIVGPAATLQAWKDANYRDDYAFFDAGKSYPTLGQYDLEDDIESLKLTCTNQPPAPPPAQ
jgi:hypothetical protein